MVKRALCPLFKKKEGEISTFFFQSVAANESKSLFYVYYFLTEFKVWRR